MLTVAEKLFARAVRSGFDSTKRHLSLQSMVPFVLPSTVRRDRPTHCGRGMIVPVTGSANTSLVVKHNMGRIAQIAWAIDNIGAPAPKIYRDPAGVANLYEQAIIADGALEQCLIYFL